MKGLSIPRYLSRGRRRLNPSSRDGIFFLFSLLLIIPFVCGFVELGNPFKISSIFYFYTTIGLLVLVIFNESKNEME